MKFLLTTTFILIATVASARDNIQIAGSSTVLPFATIVAESFAENSEFTTPVVEGGGTGAGIKKFCEGVDETTIDIVTASRQMKEEEKAVCAEAGVTEITEVRIGYDGIVFASDSSKSSFALSPAIVYTAINKNSTATNWNQIDSTLPDQKILLLIPGTKHGTREVFDQKVLIQGCKDAGAYDEILAKVSDTKLAETECSAIRTDSAVVEIDGDYTETLNRMKTDTDALGVFGLSFYENNTSILQVATINNIAPSVETISDGTYPISRPLYFYIKDAHVNVIPGILEFARFFVSDEMAGIDGALPEYGLVSDPELAKTQAKLN